MADLTKTRNGEIQRGVFKVLLDQPDGLRAKDVIQRLRDVVLPTEYEKQDYASTPGVERFGKVVRFATIAPVKAGWMVKDKGTWYLTEDGKRAYAKIQGSIRVPDLKTDACMIGGRTTNRRRGRAGT